MCWVEQTRVQVGAGYTTARMVVEWFACEWWSPREPWEWFDEIAGEFKIRGDTYRVRAAGLEGGWWVVEFMRGSHG